MTAEVGFFSCCPHCQCPSSDRTGHDDTCAIGCNDAPAAAHGHAGWPVTDEEILAKARAGLPPYCPTDPVLIDQTEYRRFAAERGPNSA